MATTTTLNRVTQIGVEVTPGTPVAATKKLQLVKIETGATPTIQSYAGTARRFPVATGLNTETSTLKLSGYLNYTEMMYVWSNLYGAPTITTPVGATTARKSVWQVPLSGSITRKIWTLEEGDAIAARQMSYGLLTGWGAKFDRESQITLDGDGMAQAQTDGFTLTSSLNPVPQIPVFGKHLNWYIDSTWSGIGTTQIPKPMQGEIKWGKDADVYWAMNRSNTSYVEHVDSPPDVDLSIQVPNDATAAAYMAAARANTTQYLRIEAVGDKIEVGSDGPDQFYTMYIDMPVRFVKMENDGDQKAVRVRTFHLAPIEDATAGFGAVLTLVNTQTGL